MLGQVRSGQAMINQVMPR